VYGIGLSTEGESVRLGAFFGGEGGQKGFHGFDLGAVALRLLLGLDALPGNVDGVRGQKGLDGAELALVAPAGAEDGQGFVDCMALSAGPTGHPSRRARPYRRMRDRGTGSPFPSYVRRVPGGGGGVPSGPPSASSWYSGWRQHCHAPSLPARASRCQPTGAAPTCGSAASPPPG
jgi:hypothetical protein